MIIKTVKRIILNNYKYFIKYFQSGLLSMGLDYASFFLLASVLGIYYLGAVVISYSLGFISNFFLNKYWTFKKKENTLPQLFKFCLLGGINLLATMFFMYLLTSLLTVPSLVSRGIVFVLVAGWNFIIYKHIIYK